MTFTLRRIRNPSTLIRRHPIPKLLATRLLSGVLVLLILTCVVFSLARATPIDPARALVGPRASPSALQQARHTLGLDEPLYIQLFRYIDRIAHGDLGTSAVTFRPIRTDIRTYLPASLELLLVAFMLAIVIGWIFGVASSLRWRGSGVFRFVIVIGSSIPIFLTAQLGILLFYQRLNILPATGRTGSVEFTHSGPTGFLLIDSLLHANPALFGDACRHLILPAIVLALAPAVALGRTLRSGLGQTRRADYIRTARVKGLSELTVLRKHAIRNSLNPVFSISGIQIAAMFGYLIIVEQIFAWPGIGSYTVQALNLGDFTTIAGVTLTLGVVYVITNLLVDLAQVVADPRIRL
jgi:peptide/nickel transport system permease protein